MAIKGRTIVPSTDPIEIAGALEAAKTIALYALTLASPDMETMEGAQKIKGVLLSQIRNANVKCDPADEERFKQSAEATIEELFGRLTVGDEPVNPKS